jgi:hypothetical protein
MNISESRPNHHHPLSTIDSHLKTSIRLRSLTTPFHSYPHNKDYPVRYHLPFNASHGIRSSLPLLTLLAAIAASPVGVRASQHHPSSFTRLDVSHLPTSLSVNSPYRYIVLYRGDQRLAHLILAFAHSKNLRVSSNGSSTCNSDQPGRLLPHSPSSSSSWDFGTGVGYGTARECTQSFTVSTLQRGSAFLTLRLYSRIAPNGRLDPSSQVRKAAVNWSGTIR